MGEAIVRGLQDGLAAAQWRASHAELEIETLRTQLEAVRGIAGNERKMSEAIIQQARAEALEEAARFCERTGDWHVPEVAAAIRALKDKQQ